MRCVHSLSPAVASDPARIRRMAAKRLDAACYADWRRPPDRGLWGSRRRTLRRGGFAAVDAAGCPDQEAIKLAS